MSLNQYFFNWYATWHTSLFACSGQSLDFLFVLWFHTLDAWFWINDNNWKAGFEKKVSETFFFFFCVWMQKYRSHRKHLLAREAEAASWSQRRNIYGVGKREVSPWLAPTMGFPPPMTTMHHFRPLHVWGHPSMNHSFMHVWPKHLPPSPPLSWPSPAPPHDPSFWHQRVNSLNFCFSFFWKTHNYSNFELHFNNYAGTCATV